LPRFEEFLATLDDPSATRGIILFFVFMARHYQRLARKVKNR
jgi:hypothetical protein